MSVRPLSSSVIEWQKYYVSQITTCSQTECCQNQVPVKTQPYGIRWTKKTTSSSTNHKVDFPIFSWYLRNVTTVCKVRHGARTKVFPTCLRFCNSSEESCNFLDRYSSLISSAFCGGFHSRSVRGGISYKPSKSFQIGSKNRRNADFRQDPYGQNNHARSWAAGYDRECEGQDPGEFVNHFRCVIIIYLVGHVEHFST